MNWIEISETRYTLEIQGIYSELEQIRRNWHLSVGDAVVTKIDGSLSATDAKAAAEKMLIELFEDAIRELVGTGKRAASRFIVIKGSYSKHCCFEYTVIDTSFGKKPYGDFWGKTMCECFTKEEADEICKSLNKNIRNDKH